MVEPKNALSFPFLVNNNIYFFWSEQKKYIFLIWQHGANCNFFQTRHHHLPVMKSRKGKTISENLTELACGSYILVFEKGSRALQLSMFSFLPNDYDHDYCSFYRRESSNKNDWAILTLLRNKIFVHMHLQNKQLTLKIRFQRNASKYSIFW